MDNLPPSLTESFTGANNPQGFIELKKGEVVLDLGCGAGLDLYFYAKAVGDKGKVYGLDISEDMVNKAKRNMELSGIKNAEISLGESDNLSFQNNFFDVVEKTTFTSNQLFVASSILALIAFLCIGIAKAKAGKHSILRSVSETLILGIVAGALAYIAGDLLETIFGA